MKKIIILIFFFLIISVHTTVFAEEISSNANTYTTTKVNTDVNTSTSSTATANEKANKEVEEVYDYLSKEKTKYEVLKDLDIKSYVNEIVKSGKSDLDMSKFTKIVVSFFIKEVIAAMELMGILLVICIISSLINNLNTSMGEREVNNIAFFACYGLSVIVLTKVFLIGVSETRIVIKEISDIMAAIFPVLLTLLAGSGGFTQAVVLDPVIIMVINLSTRVIVDIILPIILMVFALQFVNNITTEYKISKLTKLLKSSVMYVNGIVMTIFITVLTMRGIASKTFDEVALQTAKFAVDNFVPIVGGALSDAVTTVGNYSLILKNAVSSLGLVVLIAVMLFPIIKIFILAITSKILAAIVEPIADKRLVSSINSSGDALILLASCVILVSVMFFILISIIAGSRTMH